MNKPWNRSTLWLRLACCGICALVAGACARPNHTPPKDEPLLALVAASTKEAVTEIAARFTDQNGTTVEIMPGPSSGLAKQIVHSEKGDVFLSADEASAAVLAKAGLVADSRDLLSNVLVVAVPSDSSLKLNDVAALDNSEIKRIAIAEPGVPAGEYARQSLEKAGVLAAVESKFIGGTDVRATLQLVIRGEVDAGFVYRTDTLGDARVRVALEVPATMHRPIVYPLVLLRSADEKPAARAFYGFLTSHEAAAIFEKHGFGVMPAAGNLHQ